MKICVCHQAKHIPRSEGYRTVSVRQSIIHVVVFLWALDGDTEMLSTFVCAGELHINKLRKGNHLGLSKVQRMRVGVWEAVRWGDPLVPVTAVMCAALLQMSSGFF